MSVYRTPDDRFTALPGYPWQRHDQVREELLIRCRGERIEPPAASTGIDARY